jgi:hypothetical protein
LVRVEQVQAMAQEAMIPGTEPPADAQPLSSTEVPASFDTPFYCTVRLPEHRIEVAGLVRQPAATGQPLRVELGFANNARSDHSSFTTQHMISTGQTRVVAGDPAGT